MNAVFMSGVPELPVLRLLVLYCLFFLPALPLHAQVDGPVEILVTGRQPGPPLWRVTQGEHTLWIFPALSPVPDGMVWETDRVSEALAQSQEVIEQPDIDVSLPRLLMLNPINLLRGARLAKRLSRNPDDASLEEVLPAELHARYLALRSHYAPRDRNMDRLRPLVAGARLSNRVQREEGLVSDKDIMKQLGRLIRRQRGITRTPIEIEMKVEGSYRNLASRAEALMESLSKEQELVCFEEQLRRMEHDIGEMKIRANAWAQGYADEFRGVPLPGDDEDACLLMLSDSSETRTLAELRTQMETRWLAAAEAALARNTGTFAILPITMLLSRDGVMDRLRERGYEVREP